MDLLIFYQLVDFIPVLLEGAEVMFTKRASGVIVVNFAVAGDGFFGVIVDVGEV